MPFMAPALLLIYAANRMSPRTESAWLEFAHVAQGITVAVLVFAAAWAFVREFPISAGSAVVSIALLALAVIVAATSLKHRQAPEREAPAA